MDPGQRQRSSRRSTPNALRISKDKPKAITACLTCRKKKVKCSGASPCLYCSKRGLDCTISDSGERRVYSVMRIQELESRLASYEDAQKTPRVQATPPAQGSPLDSFAPISNHGQEVTPRPQSVNMISSPMEQTRVVERPNAPKMSSRRTGNDCTQVLDVATRSTPKTILVTEASEPSPQSVIAAESSLSSSYTFGSRVRTLVEGGRELAPTPGTIQCVTSNQRQIPPLAGLQNFQLPIMPSQEEAMQLLDDFVFFIGHTQNYVDTREAADRISLLYMNLRNGTDHTNLWTLEILLLLAIARLLKGTFSSTEDRETYPGEGLFQFAYEHLPSLSQLLSGGKVAIEVLALVAVYLQNINRKEEAYVYVQISTAMRLAISHGYHQTSSGTNMLYSEVAHINRLWWSIYSQERRLAAATGKPSGITDAVIQQSLPTDVIGFSPAGPMRTNIKLARIYGDIITKLYGTTPQAEPTFVSNVQQVIQSLYDVSDEIPTDLKNGMPQLGQMLSLRTSAALHLMFYQALLLTIRPLMLHVAQLILSGQPLTSDLCDSSPLGKLSRTCTEAARRLLQVLITVHRNGAIAPFGFFDFDGIFSVSFIMMLDAILNKARPEGEKVHPSPGLGEALDLMQDVANQGNTFAKHRLLEIQRTWDEISLRLDLPSDASNSSRQRSPVASSGNAREPELADIAPPNTEDARPPGDSGLLTPQLAFASARVVNSTEHAASNDQNQHPLSIMSDFDVWEGISFLKGPFPELWNGGDVPSDSQLLQDDINLQNPYSLFTGEDMVDFAEFGRHIMPNSSLPGTS